MKTISIILMLASIGVNGASICVGPLATGSGSGADWSNMAAWSGTPVRGDTWYLADGEYSGKTFNVSASGTTRITIQKATESSHGPSTGWVSTLGDGVAAITNQVTFSTDYWTLNGYSRTTRTNGHGIKLTLPARERNIVVAANFVTIANVEIEGTGPDDAPAWPSNDGIYMVTGSQQSDLVVSNCYLHDFGKAPFQLNAISNLVVTGCWVARNENHTSQHSEGLILYGTSCNNANINGNVWVDIEGTAAVAAGDVTGGVFYNNVVFWTSSYPNAGQDGSYVGNGSITSFSAQTWTNSFAHQNTIIVPATGGFGFGVGPVSGSAATGCSATNNLFVCSGEIGSRIAWDDGCAHDYNGYSGSSEFSESNATTNLTTSVFVSANDYRLVTQVPGIALGSQFSVDADGVNRGTYGTWDIGAYEYNLHKVRANTARVGSVRKP